MSCCIAYLTLIFKAVGSPHNRINIYHDITNCRLVTRVGHNLNAKTIRHNSPGLISMFVTLSYMFVTLKIMIMSNSKCNYLSFPNQSKMNSICHMICSWVCCTVFLCYKVEYIQMIFSIILQCHFSGSGVTVWLTRCLPRQSWHTVRCRYNAVNFLINIHKGHSIACSLGRGMGCLLWIQPQFMYLFMQYLTILDRVIAALECIWR